jgi:cellulose biosynthesis protein BcsQ
VIAFFNNKGGVGKTSLVYHLAWMFADLQVTVLAADLDPQMNLTAAFLDDDKLELFWAPDPREFTVHGFLQPLLKGTGDILEAYPVRIEDKLALLAGDLQLSAFEDELSQQWPNSLSGQERPFRVISAFWRMMQHAARAYCADIILLDLGPNLGAINRAGLLSADYVVVPLSPDLFSLQGLRNLGSYFKRWRSEWTDRLNRKPRMDIDLPKGLITPLATSSSNTAFASTALSKPMTDGSTASQAITERTC